jgi:hypothetical protein
LIVSFAQAKQTVKRIIKIEIICFILLVLISYDVNLEARVFLKKIKINQQFISSTNDIISTTMCLLRY